MTSALQTATTLPDLTPWLTLAALAWIGYRLVLIAVFPFAPCQGCHGRGRFAHGENWRPCRR